MPESIDQEIRTLQSIFWSERDPDGLTFAPLADAFRRKGDIREALDLLTDGMSRHPDYATGHVVATRLYSDQGMDSEAELAARRVLKLDPENLVALSTLVSLLSRKGEEGEAARHKTMLFAADPRSEEARAVADVGPDAGGVDVAQTSDAETPLEVVSGKADAAAPEITELVPETMYHEEETASLLDELQLSSDGESGAGEEELSQAMESLGLTEEDAAGIEALPGLERELDDLDALDAAEAVEEEGVAGELGADPLDLTSLSVDTAASDADEPVMDLADLAPDEPEESAMDLADLAPDEPEEPAMDLADLAPDEPEGTVMDLAELAPDEPEEPAMDLADLAPDGPEEAAMDLQDLAPDEPEELAMDLADLAPDEPEGAVMDLADLAPDEPDEPAMDLADLAPDQDVVDLAALAPEASVEELAEEMELAAGEGEGADGEKGSAEPVYTRTLAQLYVKQGFPEKAVEVLRHIQRREPHAADLAERIAELEGSGAGTRGDAVRAARFTPPSPPTDAGRPTSSPRSEDDVERRAQELADAGHGEQERDDTLFSWSGSGEEAQEESDEPIGSYFEALLQWEHGAES